MAWRDELRTASFRGVRFFTAESEKTGGRRSQVHEIPLRDEPYVEDLGRRARAFSVDAYLLGDDVFEQRDRLEEALEKPGPGILVHHFRGTLRVSVVGFRTSHSTREGGFVRISMEFVEAGVTPAPDEAPDTGARVRAGADAASTALQTVFGSVFGTSGWPDFVATAAIALLIQATDAITSAARFITGDLVSLSTLESQVGSIAARASTLVTTPSDLAAEMAGAIGDLADLSSAPESTLAALDASLAVFGSELSLPESSTPSRAQQRANQYQLASLVRRSAILEMARAETRIDFASYDDAAAERDRIAELLDGEMMLAGDEGDDDGYEALRSVYAEVVADIGARGASLARLIDFSPPATVDAVVLAYALYGDSTRADEIVARNRIRHPGFVPGGQALEILSDLG